MQESLSLQKHAVHSTCDDENEQNVLFLLCLFTTIKGTRAVKQLQLGNLNRRLMRWSLLKHLFTLMEEARPEAADLKLNAAELHKDADC